MEGDRTYFSLVAPFQIKRKQRKKTLLLFSQPKAKKSESEQTDSHKVKQAN